MNDIYVQASSDNVFMDLGLENAEELLIKAELARRITHILTTQNMDQAEAASVLGIDQSKIFALMGGKLTEFTTARLFYFLNASGRDVEIVVKPKSHPQAQTRVIAS